MWSYVVCACLILALFVCLFVVGKHVRLGITELKMVFGSVYTYLLVFFVNLSIYLHVYLHLCLFVCLSCIFIYVTVCLSINLYLSLLSLSACNFLFGCLLVCLFACFTVVLPLPIYLSMVMIVSLRQYMYTLSHNLS